MAIFKMRELLRNPEKVFETVDEHNEPCLITRHGEPVAALVPVDKDRAEEFVLATAPEFVARRQDEEHARAEKRTRSIEDVAAEFGVETQESSEQRESSSERLTEIARPERPELLPRLAMQLFGPEVSETIEMEAWQRVVEISEEVLQTAIKAGALTEESTADRAELTQRLTELNSQLFERLFSESLRQAALDQVSRPGGLAPADEHEVSETGLFEPHIVQKIVDQSLGEVSALNTDLLVDPGLERERRQ